PSFWGKILRAEASTPGIATNLTESMDYGLYGIENHWLCRRFCLPPSPPALAAVLGTLQALRVRLVNPPGEVLVDAFSLNHRGGFLLPGRQNLYQHVQNREGQNHQNNRGQHPFLGDETHLIRGIS